MSREFDVLVVGGGLAGLAFATLLRGTATAGREPPTVAVIEVGAPPADQLAAEIGLRVVALSPASCSILRVCGAWGAIPAARVQAYRRMLVWHHEGKPGGTHSIAFDAAEQGVPELGYIVESEVVRRALWRQAAKAGVALLATAVPAGLDMQPDRVQLGLADGQRLDARLVVGADGQDSWLRRALGVEVTGQPYGQRAVVGHVSCALPHRETAWQRFLPGGPLALLPLPDGRCSIVWSCPDARAQSLAAADETDFNRALTEASGVVLGELHATTPRLSFRLASSQVVQYSGLRFALIGDAAHRVHPLAGQGVNLGLQDAAALAQVLGEHLATSRADPGDPLALRRFERWRRAANLTTLAAMDALHRLFTSPVPGITRVAGAGLGLVDRAVPLKTLLADYAMGRRGDLPKCATPGHQR